MGEAQGWLFEPTFNRAIKVRRADPRLTDNAGVLLVRQADHELGLTAALAEQLIDDRDADQTRYDLIELLRQHVYALALGYSHQKDHDTLAHDTAMKLAVWDRPGPKVIDERLAGQSSDWRLIKRSASKANRRALREALAWWIGRHQRAAGRGRKVTHGTIDIDAFPIEVHGKQPGKAYHGYYRKTIYHPLVASFSAEGSYESTRLGEGFVHALLRRGNCAAIEGMKRFVCEVIRKCRDLACHLDVRIDAGQVAGPVLDAIDDRGVRFVARLADNPVLAQLAEPYLKREPGRPTKDGDQFTVELGEYQAQSWTRPYRVVLVVIDLPDPKTGMRDLVPHHFFLVTNYPIRQRSGWNLLEHYRNRGTFEDRLGEFNACVKPSLSQNRFESNEAALLLKMLAFNLAGMLRGEMEDASPNGWDLGRLQDTVLRAGARVTEHSRRLIVDVTRAAARLWDRLMPRLTSWWRDESWDQSKPRSRRWIPPPSHAHVDLVLRS
jgi:hypothetical protein